MDEKLCIMNNLSGNFRLFLDIAKFASESSINPLGLNGEPVYSF